MSTRFYGISDYLKRVDGGGKWVKLALDGGFTCPNRDGALDTRGCIFCSESGSGEFAGDGDGGRISEQIAFQKTLLAEKWPNARYIAYFQNFSNTYAPVASLKRTYDSALAEKDIEGLAIATRPDCISDAVVALLKTYRSLPVFWVELGLQSIHEKTGEWMRRGYETRVFDETFDKLKQAGIPVVVHLIAGLPGESREDFLESVAFVSERVPFGVKFHMLNVLKGTDLAESIVAEPFQLLDETTYVSWICDAIERLNPAITIHRMTGDGAKDELIAPLWIQNKRRVLNDIEKTLKARDSVQGCKILKDEAT